MGRMNAWALAAGLALLPACGDGAKPSDARNPSPGPSEAVAKPSGAKEQAPVETAVLDQALERKLCEVEWIKSINFSTPHIGFLLKPLVKTKPRITVPPGLKLTAKGDPGPGVTESTYVTVLPRTEALFPSANQNIGAWCCRLTPQTRTPKEFQYEPLPADDPLRKLIDAGNAMTPTAEWNELQVAIYAHTSDVDLKFVKKSTYSVHSREGVVVVMGRSRELAPDVGTLDRAAGILKSAGLFRPELKLFAEAEADMRQALSDLESPKKKLQALYTLGFYRTRPEALEALLDGLKAHADPKDVHYRKAALRYLWPLQVRETDGKAILDARIAKALEDALAVEEDKSQKSELQRWVDWAKQKTKAK
ncbi:MAG: hypothetical protein M5U26_04015 [Planctomycetota bacterium]|nr:hypothetical protein [Planctomycetota bacterium]